MHNQGRWVFCLYPFLVLVAMSSSLAADETAFAVPDSIITNASFSTINYHDRLLAFPLWPDQPPGSATIQNNIEHIYNRTTQQNPFGLNRAVENVTRSSVFVFPVKSDSPTPAVIIFPGGAFLKITIDKEGIDIAQWLNRCGITSIVVKYRTVPSPEQHSWNYRDSNPLYDAFYADARQAIRIIRSRSAELNIDPDKIGVMGFSAGGRLAANLLADQSGDNGPDQGAVDPASHKINFGSLIYPVIIDTLIRQISHATPPTFIVNCRDDKSAPVKDAEKFYDTLIKNGIESEAHIFETGGHGFGLGIDGGMVTQWPIRFTNWLMRIGIFEVARDTTYTLQSAYQKYRKLYPFIKPVRYDTLDGSLQQTSIIYSPATSSRPLALDIFSTANDMEASQPAVILVHGGGWSSGDRRLMYPLADYLAKQGYVALPVEYRLSPEAQYPAAVDDIQHAVSWILKHGRDYHIDPTRIAILGCSAGAPLAGLVGLRYGMEQTENAPAKPIAAIINIDGIMDFTSEIARKYEDDPHKKSTAAGRWFGGRYAEKPELWKAASPVYYVNENSPPILFINSSMPRFHAGRDAVIEKLDRFSIYHEVHTFADAPHSFWLFDPWFEGTGRLMVRFLESVMPPP